MRRPFCTTLFLFLLLAGCGRKPLPNIVLFSIDTVRADHLGCYGNEMWETSPSPFMDQLASRGVLFEQCIATRGQTHPSLASMLTGKYPITHTLRENGHILPGNHKTFVQLLKEKGYDTAGFVSNIPKVENPTQAEDSPPNWWVRGFDRFDDGFGANYELYPKMERRKWEDQWAWDNRVEELATRWVRDHEPGEEKPFFLWTHFYDPHKPYLPHESSPDFQPDYKGILKPRITYDNGVPADRVTSFINEATRLNASMKEPEHRQVLSLYDSSLFGVDARFNRLLEELHKKKMLENTWIIITSDHGEELGDHNNYYFHGASIYDAVLRIPVIVTGPGVPQGKRVKSMVQNLDIASTVLELADIDQPEDMESHSLIPVILEDTDRFDRDFAVAEWQDLIYSYSDGVYKYIFNPEGACPVKPPYIKSGGFFNYERQELYHVQSDPDEKNNIITNHQDVVQDLRKKLVKWIREEGHSTNWNASQRSEGANQSLQALGYTGVGTKRRDVQFKK
jgi:arylsulfatase